MHTGFIYKNDSAGDLASLIGKLHKDRSLLDAISDNGRKAVMAKYNWNVDKERLIKAYSHLAENNN